jgi:RNA polymerase sigma factor (sigma-70 family)
MGNMAVQDVLTAEISAGLPDIELEGLYFEEEVGSQHDANDLVTESAAIFAEEMVGELLGQLAIEGGGTADDTRKPAVGIQEPPGYLLPDTESILAEQRILQKDRSRAVHDRIVEHAQAGDERAKDKLCARLYPIVRVIASKKYKSPTEIEDYVQVAMENFPKTLARYDRKSKSTFDTYFLNRAIGAMYDQDRRYSRAEGLNRRDYKKLKEIATTANPNQTPQQQAKMRNKLLHEFIGETGISAAASFMDNEGGVSTSAIRIDELVSGRSGNKSMDNAFEIADEYDLFETLAAEMQEKTDREMLYNSLEQLPELERQVVILYYGLEGKDTLSMREIGEVVGCIESRVPQLHKKALNNLKDALEGKNISPPPLPRIRLPRPGKGNIPQKYGSKFKKSLERIENEPLSEEEERIIQDYLCMWDSNSVKAEGKTYKVFKRSVPHYVHWINTNDYCSDRREVGYEESEIVVRVTHLQADDVLSIIEMEEKLRLRTDIKLNEAFAQKFSDEQRAIIKDIYTWNNDFAIAKSEEGNVIRDNIVKAGEISDINNEAEFALAAAKEGMVDLSLVPDFEIDNLGKAEQELLATCYNCTYEQAAERLNNASSTIGSKWVAIYRKTGAANRTQAILIAFKNGSV